MLLIPAKSTAVLDTITDQYALLLNPWKDALSAHLARIVSKQICAANTNATPRGVFPTYMLPQLRR